MAVNSAPVLNNLLNRVFIIQENTATAPTPLFYFNMGFDPADVNYTNLILGASDADIVSPGGVTSLGVAITGFTGASGSLNGGVVKYSTDGGLNWITITNNSASETTALLLKGTDLFIYTPPVNGTGISGFTFHTWDGTGGYNSGDVVDLTLTGTGASTPFSSAVATHQLIITPNLPSDGNDLIFGNINPFSLGNLTNIDYQGLPPSITLGTTIDSPILTLNRIIGSNNPLLGTWVASNVTGHQQTGGTTTADIVISFFADGTYISATKGTGGTAGVDYGSYTWDSVTGNMIIQTPIVNGALHWGLGMELSVNSGYTTATIAGLGNSNSSTMTWTNAQATFNLSKVTPDVANPVIDSWVWTNPVDSSKGVLTLLANGQYVFADIKDPTGLTTVGSGFETGTWTTDGFGNYTFNNVLNTDGANGLTATAGTSRTLKITTNGGLFLDGLKGNDTLVAGLFDTLTGGAGADTFEVHGSALITDLGAGGQDVLKALNGSIVNATIGAAWTATVETQNQGALAANIETVGKAVNLSLVTTGTKGFSVNNNGNATVLRGSAFADVLQGNSAGPGNKVVGGPATLNDLIVGNGGNDTLSGGEGNNTLTGGAGLDTFTVTGADNITDLGFGGADVVNVGVGATAIATIAAAWTATAATSNDGAANITTSGKAVNLTAVTLGTNGFNVTNTGLATAIRGSALADSLVGAIGNDTLIGNAGNDTLAGGLGTNTLTGGAGLDTFTVTGADNVTDLGFGGADVVNVGVGATANATIAAAWTATAATSNDGVANITTSGKAVNLTAVTLGTNGFNVTNTGLATAIRGSALADSIVGGAGSDILIGNAGNDTILGGSGSNLLTGGLGVDTFVVTNMDAITDLGYGGQDVLNVSALGGDVLATIAAAWTATSATTNDGLVSIITNGKAVNLSAVILGTHGFSVTNNGVGTSLIGSAFADTLNGGVGNDILNGGAGNDIITGGAGNDTITAGAGNDTIVFNTATGLTNIDTIIGFELGKDVLQFNASVFTALGSPGTLTPNQWYAAAGATTANSAVDHFIYNTTTGALYYDADGNGATAAVQVAVIGTAAHALLTYNDIHVG